MYCSGVRRGGFTVGFDFIVMNRIPIERIKATRPGLFKPIAFHVLMHEYIHSNSRYECKRIQAKACLFVSS